MNAAWALVILWLFAVAMMTLGWRWQQRHRNAGIVDALWAAGLGIAAVWLAITGTGTFWARLTVAALGGLWGARLAVHLWHRTRDESEDGRYQFLRAHWLDSQFRFFLFFQFQALLILLFALPFLAAAHNPVTHPAWLFAGLTIWLLSVTGETIADRQLARFRADPANRGRTCRGGWWRYSRHPNYFFEWLHWFAYVCIAVGSPWWWLACAGPVVMYVFLRWISGIPFTEAQAVRTRGDDYRDYQRSTSMLLLWFPKSSSDIRS